MPLRDPDFLLPQLVTKDPRITIGNYTYSDGPCYLIVYQDVDRISIGKFCSFSYQVTVFGGGEHRVDWVSTFPMRVAFGEPLALNDGHPASKGPTIIGNDVYLGFRSVVLSGVNIGDGAVIGACSVVTSDVPPYAIVAGNPAKVIRFRFPDNIAGELLHIQWWYWPIEKIKRAIPFLSSDDTDSLFEFALRN